MEIVYYSTKNTTYPLVCFHCGGNQSSICNNDTIRDLKWQYQALRSICTLYFSADKQPATRGLQNVAAKKKKNKLKL